MLSGKPKVVSTQTTADTDTVSAVLYPSNKAVTWGGLVYEMLYEFAGDALIVHDTKRNRLYASEDAATVLAYRNVIIAKTSETVLIPQGTVAGIFYNWIRSGDVGDQWQPIAQEMTYRRRTLWDTIDRIYSLGQQTGKLPFFVVDQANSALRILTIDVDEASDDMAAVTPSGNTLCVSLELRKGAKLIFEGGATL